MTIQKNLSRTNLYNRVKIWNGKLFLSGYAMLHIFSCKQTAYLRNIYMNEYSTSKLLYTYVYALLRNKDI